MLTRNETIDCIVIVARVELWTFFKLPHKITFLFKQSYMRSYILKNEVDLTNCRHELMTITRKSSRSFEYRINPVQILLIPK